MAAKRKRYERKKSKTKTARARPTEAARAGERIALRILKRLDALEQKSVELERLLGKLTDVVGEVVERLPRLPAPVVAVERALALLDEHQRTCVHGVPPGTACAACQMEASAHRYPVAEQVR